MKLALLFAKYLYQNKQLNLPGIGVFQIDPSLIIPEIADKNFPDFIQQIRYTQKPVLAPDEEFINFIRTETGKIKPLAESDLDSFLTDGKISLNSGKPFYLEGIGSLLKNRTGLYDFTPGMPQADRLENYFGEMKEDALKKRSVYEEERVQQSNGFGRFIIWTSVIAGIVLIIWGGYAMYNRNSEPTPSPAIAPVNMPADVDTTKPADTVKLTASASSGVADPTTPVAVASSASPETLANQKPEAFLATSPGPGTYKFVIEKTSKLSRATKRYDQLKSYYKNIQMETKDSSSYTLFFILPSAPTDTTKVKDSLKRLYGSREVYIEQ